MKKWMGVVTLGGEEIPIEARIVAVADIFDALTSMSPYKEAWSNEDAYLELNRLAGTKLNEDCVAALCNNQKQICKIQQSFVDY